MEHTSYLFSSVCFFNWNKLISLQTFVMLHLKTRSSYASSLCLCCDLLCFYSNCTQRCHFTDVMRSNKVGIISLLNITGAIPLVGKFGEIQEQAKVWGEGLKLDKNVSAAFNLRRIGANPSTTTTCKNGLFEYLKRVLSKSTTNICIVIITIFVFVVIIKSSHALNLNVHALVVKISISVNHRP